MTEAINTFDSTEDKSTDETNSLDKDTIHNLLSNSRRRAVIRILDNNGTLEKGELATRVAMDECDKTRENLGRDERKRVQVSLLQQHFDKLADAGVIEREYSAVSLAENAEELIWHLDAEPPNGVLDCLKTSLKELL